VSKLKKIPEEHPAKDGGSGGVAVVEAFVSADQGDSDPSCFSWTSSGFPEAKIDSIIACPMFSTLLVILPLDVLAKEAAADADEAAVETAGADEAAGAGAASMKAAAASLDVLALDLTILFFFGTVPALPTASGSSTSSPSVSLSLSDNV
jgi:hypothetical protein